jgi:hypothetical protein
MRAGFEDVSGSSAYLFEAITSLPPGERAKLVERLGRETDLLEQWRDVAVFDARQDEESVSLDDHLRSLGLKV